MTDLAITAANLLARFGEPVTVSDGLPGVTQHDPVTSEPIASSAGDPVTANGYPSRYNKTEIDGENVRAGDVRLILEVITPRPQVGWSATVDGVTYRMMKVMPVRRSGADKVLIIQLRAN